MKLKHNHISQTTETIILSVILLVGMAIFVPLYLKQQKTVKLDQQYYDNKILSEGTAIKGYAGFWKKYNEILTERADMDGNTKVSVQEKAQFDEQFFGGIEVTVDPVTKIITKKDGTNADPNALICHLNTFYVDKPWIKPICPSL